MATTLAPRVTSEPVQRSVRPWVWLFLNLPFGATSGFVSVTLGFILKAQGLADDKVAGLVALNLLPHTVKFFWAPVADVTLSRKKWYVLANLASCVAIFALAFVPIQISSLKLIGALIFVNSLAITFVGMAVEGLMAHGTPESERGRAAGWFQAGNLGGAGLAGAVGLVIADHVSTKAAFIVIAVALAACSFALNWVPDAPAEDLGAGNALQRTRRAVVVVAKDIWFTIATRRGVVALILCFLPIGCAAATNLFGAIGDRWGASADVVALSAGTLGGVASALGCIAGGWLSDSMRRAVAYAVSGLILAAVAVLWAIAPQNAVFYVIFTLTYSFGSGIAYACFTGFVLEIIGKGAAATKYNAFASLSNIPITYVGLVLGWVSTKFGPVRMLWADAGTEIAGIVVLLLVIAIIRPGRAAQAPGSAAGGPADLPAAVVVRAARSVDR